MVYIYILVDTTSFRSFSSNLQHVPLNGSLHQGLYWKGEQNCQPVIFGGQTKYSEPGAFLTLDELRKGLTMMIIAFIITLREIM